MNISIINYEAKYGINGILTKYANKLEEELTKLGHKVCILTEPDSKADINHHLNFLSYIPSGTIDTTMVTHLTGDKNQSKEEKISILKNSLKTSFGICMSKSEMQELKGMGIKKIDYAPHAHSDFPRRPRYIAVLTNIYPDGRKRVEMFVEMFKSLKKKDAFIFRIIGKGWEEILKQCPGIQAQWQPEWNAPLYEQLLNTSDYLLYTGDESSLAQSQVDAKHVGLPIISPLNKDLTIEYPFNSQKELNKIFDKMQENEVENWTWKSYAKKHCIIWDKLLKLKHGNTKKMQKL